MANKISGVGHQLYVEGYDISPDIGSISNAGSPRGVQLMNALNTKGTERTLLRTDGIIEMSTFFDDGTDLIHTALSGLLTTDQLAMWPFGEVQGDVAGFLTSKQSNYDWSVADDGSMNGSVQLLGNGNPLEWGEMFTTGKDTQSSSGDTSNKDDLASSADGLVAQLQVFSVGSGTPTLTIEDSPDNSVWSTLKAFAASASRGAQRVTVTGTVDRHLRAHFTGTFTDMVYALCYRRGDANELAGLIV